MTQEERRLVRYNEVVAFMEENHRSPSKYNLEERNARNRLRHTKKEYRGVETGKNEAI